jgi:phage-related protein
MLRKAIIFVGEALEELKTFPESARKEAGVQLYRVQLGMNPADWKPMTTIGTGVREIRIRDSRGAFRVIYVVRRQDVIYVLHCFQKKSQKTDRRDLSVAIQRLKEINDGSLS